MSNTPGAAAPSIPVTPAEWRQLADECMALGTAVWAEATGGALQAWCTRSSVTLRAASAALDLAADQLAPEPGDEPDPDPVTPGLSVMTLPGGRWAFVLDDARGWSAEDSARFRDRAREAGAATALVFTGPVAVYGYEPPATFDEHAEDALAIVRDDELVDRIGGLVAARIGDHADRTSRDLVRLRTMLRATLERHQVFVGAGDDDLVGVIDSLGMFWRERHDADARALTPDPDGFTEPPGLPLPAETLERMADLAANAWGPQPERPAEPFGVVIPDPREANGEPAPRDGDQANEAAA